MTAITDSTSIAKAMNYFGIDTDLLNPSNIDKNLISQAREYLSQIKNQLELLAKLDKEGQENANREFDYEKIGQTKDEIADLSS